MKHSHVLGLGLGLGLGLSLGLTAGAAHAQATATFQVTSFSVAVTGGSLTWLPSGAYQTQAAEAAEAGGLGGNDWASASFLQLQDSLLSTAVAHAAASSQADVAGTLAGQALAWPSLVDSTAAPHFATAMAQQAQEFSLSAAGTVQFTVGYVVMAAAVDGDQRYTYGQSALDFQAGNYDSGWAGQQGAELFSFDQTGGSGSQQGSFTLTVSLAGPGEVGFYNLRGNAFATATAAVPEPGQWALMLLGLAGLAARVRRSSCV